MHHPTFQAFKNLTAQTLLSGIFALGCQAAEGFTDTPMQPNGQWHVHDPDRPKPPVVTPGEHFSHQAPAPSDATVLFDGTDFSQWTGRNDQVKWKLENGYMETTRTGRIRTRESFGDFQLHLEFATRKKSKARARDGATMA